MKKTLLLLLAVMTVVFAEAQNHGDLKFAGASKFGIPSMDAYQDNETDTVVVGDANSSITLPVMYYKTMGMTLPSIKFTNLKYNMEGTYPNMAFAWHQEYADTTVNVIVDGEAQEKHLKNVTLDAKYTHITQAFEVKVTMTYGSMPFPLTYTMSGSYVKPETSAVETVTVAGEQGKTVKKVLRNGRLEIVSGDREFDFVGREIK